MSCDLIACKERDEGTIAVLGGDDVLGVPHVAVVEGELDGVERRDGIIVVRDERRDRVERSLRFILVVWSYMPQGLTD